MRNKNKDFQKVETLAHWFLVFSIIMGIVSLYLILVDITYKDTPTFISTQFVKASPYAYIITFALIILTIIFHLKKHNLVNEKFQSQIEELKKDKEL